MIMAPTFSTPETDKLCREISKKSNGCIFLGFSGGKDSVCSWIQCRKYFSRIIPFHCATLPGMTYREKALRYYENEFETRILRLMDANIQSDLTQGIYQLREDGPFIMSLGWHHYDKLEVLEYLRNVYNLPKAWCAFGIQASDSIDRRIYCSQYRGRNDANKTFYPCWDWPHDKVIETVQEAGLRLSSEYLYSSRTIEGTPSATYTEILREHFPSDYRVLTDFYPLVEAKVVREKINERVADELMDEMVSTERAKAAGGGTDCAEGEGNPSAEGEDSTALRVRLDKDAAGHGEALASGAVAEDGTRIFDGKDSSAVIEKTCLDARNNGDRIQRRRLIKDLCWAEAKSLGLTLKSLVEMPGSPEDVAESVRKMKASKEAVLAERLETPSYGMLIRSEGMAVSDDDGDTGGEEPFFEITDDDLPPADVETDLAAFVEGEPGVFDA